MEVYKQSVEVTVAAVAEKELVVAAVVGRACQEVELLGHTYEGGASVPQIEAAADVVDADVVADYGVEIVVAAAAS